MELRKIADNNGTISQVIYSACLYLANIEKTQ